MTKTVYLYSGIQLKQIGDYRGCKACPFTEERDSSMDQIKVRGCFDGNYFRSERSAGDPPTVNEVTATSTKDKYPKYYKPVGEQTHLDVYAVHKMFNIQDPSGAIQHASKKLLLSGVRTGGKSQYDDIKEARDTLTRYLELHKPEGE